MWWLLIPGILLGMVIYLLCAPFFIEVDSVNGFFRFRFHVLAYGSLELRDHSLFMKLKIAWWEKEFDLLQPAGKKPKQIAGDKKAVKKKKSFHISHLPQRIIAVFKSFRVRTCYIMIDTGNMPANGILYPWFYLLSARINQTVLINFHGENEIILKIKNSAARTMWAFIRIK